MIIVCEFFLYNNFHGNAYKILSGKLAGCENVKRKRGTKASLVVQTTQLFLFIMSSGEP